MSAVDERAVVLAIVAGQIMGGVIAAGKEDDAADAVDIAEDILREAEQRVGVRYD